MPLSSVRCIASLLNLKIHSAFFKVNNSQDEEEHLFCKKCIERWLENHDYCPIDRKKIKLTDFKTPSRIARNFLNESVFVNFNYQSKYLFLICSLELICEFKDSGCDKVLKYENFGSHLKECQYNEANWTTCLNGCELKMEKAKLKVFFSIYEARAFIIC